jgi:UDP-N-acetyl-D-glucosamine dehydrogenase
MDYSKSLIEKFQNKTARVAVIGMGYVGLPFATVFAEAGFTVTGIDAVKEKMDRINRGESYIMDVPSEKVAALVKAGKLSGTTDFSVLANIDAVAICVPTPLRQTGDPDLSFIVSAAEGIAPYVHPGMVVVLESSTYPGTTRELVLPTLTDKSKLKIGEEIFVAFSPSVSTRPHRLDHQEYPKVIGGMTEKCTEISAAWYAQALDTVVPVSSTEVAEMAKLLENTFRMINIGFVNELALM